MRSLALVLAVASLGVPGCLWFRPPRYLTDPALNEADAGARRGDPDDRSALRRLARVPSFPVVSDPTDPAEDAAIAAATVAVGATTAEDSGTRYDRDLQSAVKFVLRRRRQAAFHAIAVALHHPAAKQRVGAQHVLSDVYIPCARRAEVCAGWPERAELARAVLDVATSDGDATVRSAAVGHLLDLPGTDAARAAIERESERDIRLAWLRIAAAGTTSAEGGIDLADRAARDGSVLVSRDLIEPYLAATNRALLEDAYRRGNVDFRRAVGAAIWNRHEPTPWAAKIIEEGLFDEDPSVRADFAGNVTAIDTVTPTVRARLEATAATWESSRNALAFLRAKEAGRPFR